MKFFIFISAVIILALSCNKEEEIQNSSSSNYYYLSGTISDTTNGNTVIGLKLELQSCTSPFSIDSLTDNTYSLLFVTNPSYVCNPSTIINVKNSNDSTIARIHFPFSKLIEDCTVNIDLAF